jgi:hypothetical protein
VANHKQIYGITARWNYFEAGLGKGPCDGLGGTCKRMADGAMRSGKVIIQDAKGFFEWAISSSVKNVKFKGVSMIRVDFGPISETVYIDIISNTIIER